MILYYDRQGNPLTIDQYLAMFEGSAEDFWRYKRVAETTVGKFLWVSTVWLGIDHGYRLSADEDNYRPLIFETMIFAKWDYSELGVWRYSTEAQALAGHDQAVARAREKYHGWVKHARDERRARMKQWIKARDEELRQDSDGFLPEWTLRRGPRLA